MFIQPLTRSNSLSSVRFQTAPTHAPRQTQAEMNSSLAKNLQALRQLFQGLASFADGRSEESLAIAVERGNINLPKSPANNRVNEWAAIATERGHINHGRPFPEFRPDERREKAIEMGHLQRGDVHAYTSQAGQQSDLNRENEVSQARPSTKVKPSFHPGRSSKWLEVALERGHIGDGSASREGRADETTAKAIEMGHVSPKAAKDARPDERRSLAIERGNL